MLIAVSANNSNVDSPFEPRFGRAAGFVVFDSETGESRFVDNSGNAQVAGGAGLQTAQLLADQGVSVAISGTFGPKAEQALQAGRIEMVTVQSGTVRELAENYVAEFGGEGQPVADLKRSPNSLSRFGGGCRRMGGTGRGMGMAGGGRGMGGGGRGMGGGGRGMGGGQY
ncbi:NifB/NifX family molybdenum-iron cluster-binding protein [Maridesulfovibrio sp.]|uniref:NifB/NifX family molybdenum-iron cluster-binding protein n=1 Tax=Maridesulfovibrio sp. TaxID=2795000 RepID=UPI003BAD4AB5